MSKTFGEWLFVDIHNNSYLNKLYIRLITQYTNKYFISVIRKRNN